jgi:sodium/proline symporter
VTRTEAIVVTLIAYKLVMVAIGLIANRLSHDEDDYFLGGRRLGPGVAALSASASSSSVWTLIGVSGYAYGSGLAAIWLLPACVGGFALNWVVLAPALRRISAERGAITVTDMLAGPVGTPRRRAVVVVASAIVLLSLLTYVAAQFQGAGKAFAETFDMGFESALLLGAGIVVFYTLLGGFWAVSLTDTIQGGMMVIAAVALPVLAVAGAGFADIGASLVPAGTSVWAAASEGLGPAASVGLILGLLGIGLGYPGQPHVVNRFMALRDDRAVVVGRRIALSWAVVIYAGMIGLGWAARVLLPELGHGEDAFVASTERLLPPVLAGIMVAAVLSAIMSTADSQLLVAASTVSHDLLGANRTATSDPRQELRRSRATVLLLSLAAVLVALILDESIFSSVLFAWTAMGSAFGPLLLVSVLRARPPAGWVLAAMLVGFGLSVAAHLWPAAKGGALERVVPFVLALALSWVGASRATRARSGSGSGAG